MIIIMLFCLYICRPMGTCVNTDHSSADYPVLQEVRESLLEEYCAEMNENDDGTTEFQSVGKAIPLYMANPHVQAFLDSQALLGNTFDIVNNKFGKFVLLDEYSMLLFENMRKFMREENMKLAIDDDVLKYFMKSRNADISLLHYFTANVVQMPNELHELYFEWRENFKDSMKREMC